MNRLILVGNGFDLAHGLKTGYNDFMLWYIKTCLEAKAVIPVFEDQLICIANHNGPNSHISELLWSSQFTSMSVSDFVDYCYRENKLYHFLQGGAVELPEGKTFLFSHEIKIKSRLLNSLLANCNAGNWVDIENEFYEYLKVYLHVNDKVTAQQRLIEVNADMEFIIGKLEEYLSQLPVPPELPGYHRIINALVKGECLAPLHKDLDFELKNIYILDFNYTPTIQQYARHRENVSVNHIHGELNVKSNPIVFGFGDELDEDYILMERSKLKGFFKYIKSFWYFNTHLYHDLLRFLQSDKFEVIVLGHSCGLSDRTMLNMIFENQNCIAIWIYYYEKGAFNNYTQLTEEISRHFSNKGEMREKVMPKTYCEPMPQYHKLTDL